MDLKLLVELKALIKRDATYATIVEDGQTVELKLPFSGTIS